MPLHADRQHADCPRWRRSPARASALCRTTSIRLRSSWATPARPSLGYAGDRIHHGPVQILQPLSFAVPFLILGPLILIQPTPSSAVWRQKSDESGPRPCASQADRHGLQPEAGGCYSVRYQRNARSYCMRCSPRPARLGADRHFAGSSGCNSGAGAGIIYGVEHWSKHAPENKEDKDDE